MALRLASRQGRLVVFGYNAVTSRIEWIHGPGAQQYAGSPLSLDGSMVMAYYKDGTTSDITGACAYDPEEGTLLQYGGELNINANYTDHAGNEFTADTQIEVADVEELVFTGLAKPIQKEGAALDLSGAVLAVNYSDGTSRSVDAANVTFEPAAGEILSHMEELTVRASWKNPATGSDYSAEFTLTIDEIEGIYFTHAPNKATYADGEPFVLTGATVGLKYKVSGDVVDVTSNCTFYPESGEIMSSYGTILSATYGMESGTQYTCETLLNVQVMTVPIAVIGQVIGEDLGLEFTDDLPSDFWDDYSTQDVPYIPADGDYYLTQDIYGSIVDYLAQKGAFAKCERYGDIPYMILPAGKYVSADGKYSIEATADIYIIAAMEKRNGLPEQLPNPSCVDYPYTNLYAYNQIQVLTFTLNASDYIKCSPGLKGGYNSATSGICRKMAGLGLYDVSDDTMYTNYVTFESDSIVNIPGILALPWCWYDDVPHDLNTLKSIVQGGEPADGCQGIRHKGKVPYLTYSKGSVYEEVKEQFPELFESNATYGDTEYVHVDS
ncbi:MAG: hypothetical protein IJ089_02270 [Clostridia bacterium]|nr:hypothetical protein [Clostridia bacterium]